MHLAIELAEHQIEGMHTFLVEVENVSYGDDCGRLYVNLMGTKPATLLLGGLPEDSPHAAQLCLYNDELVYPVKAITPITVEAMMKGVFKMFFNIGPIEGKAEQQVPAYYL